MKKINSYIFLEKDNEKCKKNEKHDLTIDLSKDVNYVLEKIFNIDYDDLLLSELEEETDKSKDKFEKLMLGIHIGKFQFKYENITKEINLKLSMVNSMDYLDIIIEDDSEDIIIKFMKEIDKKIIYDSKLSKNYNIVTSYDSVSEYYCNKVYPKLSEFERKFRKLLFITYTAQFKEKYFEITIPKELQSRTKQKIKNKENDYRIQQYFYSLDFHDFEQLLFEKRWSEYDEKQLIKYLKKNNDLSQLTDSEIRDKMLSIRPTNDWSRFFSNKMLDEDFENIIKKIGKLRNIVAHNKIIQEEEYNELNNLLKNSIINIDKAINIAESEDFKKVNEEKMKETIEKAKEIFNNIIKIITEGINL